MLVALTGCSARISVHRIVLVALMGCFARISLHRIVLVGLMGFFYGHSLSAKLAGVMKLIGASMPASKPKAN